MEAEEWVPRRRAGRVVGYSLDVSVLRLRSGKQTTIYKFLHFWKENKQRESHTHPPREQVPL